MEILKVIVDQFISALVPYYDQIKNFLAVIQELLDHFLSVTKVDRVTWPCNQFSL